MRVVITGGSGFVGSFLCDHYHNLGWEVVCIDNLSTGRRENVAHLEESGRFHLIIADTSSIDTWRAPELTRAPCSLVLYFASAASPVDYHNQPIETMHASSAGAENGLRYAFETGSRFLFASTSEVYGDPLQHPQSEDYLGNVDPIGPRSVYDESKRYAEALTMAFHRTYGVDTAIARIFNTYGPRMREDDGRVIPQFVTQALAGEPLTVYGDGEQTRSFCYVNDLVRGIAALAASSEHLPVNLGNPDERTVRQVAEQIISTLGSSSGITYHPLPQGDPKLRCPDISRAKALLGWEPEVDFADGLKEAIAYFAGRKPI